MSRGARAADRASDADYRFTTFIGDAVQFVRDVVGTPAILVGQSAGGFTAMGAAAQLPELVRGVYSEDAVPLMYTGEGVPPALLQFFGVLSDTLERSDAQRWSVLQFAAGVADALPAWAVNDPAALIYFARIVFGTDASVLRATTSSRSWVSPAEARAVEMGLRCPVHVAQGEAAVGGIVTNAHLDGLRQAGVNLTTTYFAGAGHMITATHIKPYLADLRSFLRRIEGERG